MIAETVDANVAWPLAKPFCSPFLFIGLSELRESILFDPEEGTRMH